MSPRLGRGGMAADHERARELAATRLDQALTSGDVAWIETHLAGCADCLAVAAEYEDQRLSLRTLRLAETAPPRDLWARTAAAIEDEGGARVRRAGWISRSLPMAPVAGLLVVAIAVGVGLFNGRSLFPDSTTKGDGPMPTPMNVLAAEVQVLSRGDGGVVQVLSRRLDQVCPVGAEACGISRSFAVTTTATIWGSATLDAIISPTRDRMVVVDRGEGAGGVYVVDIAPPSSGTSSAPATLAPPATATPASQAPATQPPATQPLVTQPPATQPPATHTPATEPPATVVPATMTPATQPPATKPPGTVIAATQAPAMTPATTAPATVTPATQAPATLAPATAAPATPAPTPPAPDVTPDPEATPAPTDTATAPAPTPSIAVSPAPGGAIEIARGVVVVGGVAAYSPDGTRFAFTARPADGSAGPDVFVWTVGDDDAHPVTSDHRTVFAGWLEDHLLVSRVIDGVPGSMLVSLADGAESRVGPASGWRPAVGPGHRTAVWWDGTMKLGLDGLTPVPETGRLILDAWKADPSDPSDPSGPQVVTTGPLSDWEVRWDEAGTVVAVWTTTAQPGEAGLLNLYAIDPGTGRADLANPLLAAAPAFAGFSLKPGRLVWSAPGDGEETTVQVAAWSGRDMGRLELPTEQGVTVIR